MGFRYFYLVVDFLREISGLSENQKNTINDLVFYAMNQTRIHIANTRKAHADVPSAILSFLWMETANRLQEINNEEVKEWGKMLREKARYWSDPKGYNPDELDEYNIRLVDVENQLAEFTK